MLWCPAVRRRSGPASMVRQRACRWSESGVSAQGGGQPVAAGDAKSSSRTQPLVWSSPRCSTTSRTCGRVPRARACGVPRTSRRSCGCSRRRRSRQPPELPRPRRRPGGPGGPNPRRRGCAASARTAAAPVRIAATTWRTGSCSPAHRCGSGAPRAPTTHLTVLAKPGRSCGGARGAMTSSARALRFLSLNVMVCAHLPRAAPCFGSCFKGPLM